MRNIHRCMDFVFESLINILSIPSPRVFSNSRLHDRTGIEMTGAHKVIYNRKNNDAPRADDGVVHLIILWVHLRGPETEEDNDGEVSDCAGVDENAPYARAMEGSPDQLGTWHVDDVIIVVAVYRDVTLDSADEK